MKISRKAKTGCALVLAALMTLTGLSMQQTYAAGAIDFNKECSITVSALVGQNNSVQDKEYKDDLKEMHVPVAIYRVAEIDVTGQKFTPLEPFGGMIFDISEKTTASQWQDMAKKAMEILDSAEPEAYMTGSLNEGALVETGTAGETEKDWSVTFQNPEKGLYLVVAGAEYDADKGARYSYNSDYTKKYLFTPYLTALPSSVYTTSYDDSGNPMHTGSDGTLSDDWVYETRIGLKTEAEPLFGRLNITKRLQNFNETLADVSFVFLVEGTDGNGNTYSEVVSTTHTGLTVDGETVTLEHIPAGMTVTVTEIYSGASYEPTGMVSQKVLIWSDEAVGKEVDGVTIEAPAAVSFENRYNGGNRGGYGVNNQFERENGVWEWKGSEF